MACEILLHRYSLLREGEKERDGVRVSEKDPVNGERESESDWGLCREVGSHSSVKLGFGTVMLP